MLVNHKDGSHTKLYVITRIIHLKLIGLELVRL
jgi:hypothetical protein